MPCNLYGYGDNCDLENSHVIPALIQKYHDAKINNKSIVKVWGTEVKRNSCLLMIWLKH